MKYFIIFYIVLSYGIKSHLLLSANDPFVNIGEQTKNKETPKTKHLFMKMYNKIFNRHPQSTFPYVNKKYLSGEKFVNKSKQLFCDEELKYLCKKQNLNSDLDALPHPTNSISLKEYTESTKKLFQKYQSYYNNIKENNYGRISEILNKNNIAYTEELIDYYNLEFNKKIEIINKKLNEEAISLKFFHFLTPYMKQMIRGNFHQLEKIDTIIATQELIEKTKKVFLCKVTNNNACSAEDTKIYNIIMDNKYLDTQDTINYRHFSNNEKKIITTLINKFNLKNHPKATSLILSGYFQRAIWNLRKEQNYDGANFIEQSLVEIIFQQDNIIDIQNFKLGFSKTFLTTTLENSHGIYKPKISFIKNPLSYISSNYKAEVAAYMLDKELDLNMVPITHLALYNNFKLGSHQYFIKKSYRARIMSSYDGIKVKKFGIGNGRAKKTNNMIFFDWLIDNWDRNMDNYLITPDGNCVLIDHGFSFLRKKTHINISDKRFSTLKPDPRIIKKISEIIKEPKRLDSISALIGTKKTIRILNKLKIYMHHLNIATH